MQSKNKMDMLNFLRIMAFFIIFLLHAKIFISIPWNENVSLSWILYTPAWAGVWIFFMLSGYGIGAGFVSGKYELSINGIAKYFLKRIFTVILLYYFYLLIVALFISPQILFPSRENLSKWVSLLFFDYQQEFLHIEFGLSWYLTTLMRLYLVAPFGYFIIEKFIKKRWHVYISIVVIIAIGFIMRIAMGYHIKVINSHWDVAIYKPFYFNLDIFFIGFLLNKLKQYAKPKESGLFCKAVAFISLFVLITYNSYIYYQGAILSRPYFIKIYQYILPSVYIVIVGLFIYFFEVRRNYSRAPLNTDNLRKNPVRIIDYWAKLLLPMYLFHSTILLCLQREIPNKWYEIVARVFKVSTNLQNFFHGCLFTLLALILTVLWAIVINWIIAGKEKNRLFDYLYKVNYAAIYQKASRGILCIAAKVFPLKK